MTQEELKKALEAHNHYLAQDCEGWENMRADLSGADLSCAYLRKADLSGADLNGAYLRKANLINADLSDANLINADLSDANLINADLSDANLINADLSGADLGGANLWRADLGGANLSGAQYNEKTAFLAFVCPEEGDFIAWKKVGEVIVKLRIPSESRRSSATSRKCRCEFAEVLELQNLDGTTYKDDKVVNDNYVETIYKVGEIVHPDSWDDNRWNECSHGIHFFSTRDEAVRD